MDKNVKSANRLEHESSPYLRQHAYNPVDWYPWGEEALRAAREQDKAILLSIGYSACHWCHVMEHESFEDEEIAELMNEHFINIKVDREERPDLDAIYMSYVQMTTGSGGWPLTTFLTPEQMPFFGGTYFPPHDHYGRPGFKRVLQTISKMYKEQRQKLERGHEETLKRLTAAAQLNATASIVDETILEKAYTSLSRQFDPHHGGFGGAPKFPSAMNLGFLLRFYHRKRNVSALEMINLSLREMAHGGIYDQLGGGFHRYSVDEQWLIPHFEKMLYDNALLTRLYLEAYQATGEPLFRQIVEETLTYVQREMLDPAGGFYSSQDADSEGEEGKFFLWSMAEVQAVLGKEEVRLFADYFDVTRAGNFEDKNILHPRMDLNAFASNLHMSGAELKRLLDQHRKKLFQARGKRIAPGRDEKVLAAWNGLMLTAFSQAAWVFNRADYLNVSLRNAQFLVTEMMVKGRLMRSWKDGKTKLNAYLEDYALVIEGLLTTYQASGDTQWLDWARDLMELQCTLFQDTGIGDFFFTSSDHESLLVRQKEYFDNATPSGNSVSCFNLLRLAKLVGEKRYYQQGEQILRYMANSLSRHPMAFGYWLQALDFFFGPVEEIALIGPRDEREKLLQPLRTLFLPCKVIAIAEVVDQNLAEKVPLLAGKSIIDGKTAAYVCQDYICQKPVTSPEQLEKLLLHSR